MLVSKLALTLALATALFAAVVRAEEEPTPGKCWQRSQQCCFQQVECGWRCREGSGFKHCWKKYCNQPVCSEIKARTAVPNKPDDEVGWADSIMIDCTEKPHECGSHPTGMDYDVDQPMVEPMEELPMPSDQMEDDEQF